VGPEHEFGNPDLGTTCFEFELLLDLSEAPLVCLTHQTRDFALSLLLFVALLLLPLVLLLVQRAEVSPSLDALLKEGQPSRSL
jgi:hypothetical protein